MPCSLENNTAREGPLKTVSCKGGTAYNLGRRLRASIKGLTLRSQDW